MTEAEIYSGLQDIFNEVFRRQDITLSPELTAEDVPGWDSFRYISLIMATEKRFHMKLRGPDIDDLKNIGDLVSAVAAKTAQIR
jgi:acyl carrier protein